MLKILRSLADGVILLWIHERYGDFYEELKPPRGLSPFDKPSRLEKLTYKCKHLLWRIEKYFYRGAYWRNRYPGRIFKKEFLATVPRHHFEAGYESVLDTFIEKSIKSYGERSVHWWLCSLYKSQECRNTRLAILETLSHQDVDVGFYAISVAATGLYSGDSEFEEAGLRCIENWEALSCITILKQCKPLSLDYLEEQRLLLIEQLEARALSNEGANLQFMFVENPVPPIP